MRRVHGVFGGPCFFVPCCLGLLLLAGCAAPLPVRVLDTPRASGGAPVAEASATDRISQLEQSARQLRQQHDAMGETLKWLDGEIRGLRRQNSTPMHLPTEAAAPVPVPSRASVRRSPPMLKPPVAPPSAPTPIVAPLIGDDLTIEPETTPPVPASTQISTPTTSAQPSARVYLVHVASYRSAAQAGPGWRALTRQHGDTLAEMSPHTTPFRDAQGRSWVRLGVGPFSAAAEAARACDRLKQAKLWCDVVGATPDALNPLVPSSGR